MKHDPDRKSLLSLYTYIDYGYKDNNFTYYLLYNINVQNRSLYASSRRHYTSKTANIKM